MVEKQVRARKIKDKTGYIFEATPMMVARKKSIDNQVKPVQEFWNDFGDKNLMDQLFDMGDDELVEYTHAAMKQKLFDITGEDLFTLMNSGNLSKFRDVVHSLGRLKNIDKYELNMLVKHGKEINYKRARPLHEHAPELALKAFREGNQWDEIGRLLGSS